MKKLHIAISTDRLAATIDDYTVRLGEPPALVVAGEYALWRTDTLNVSVRYDAAGAAGTLRHLGWEDPAANNFTEDTDVNGIVWERFSAAQQAADSGANIILLNVVEEIPGWAAAELPGDLVERSRQHAQAELQAIAKASGMQMSVEVRSGHPYTKILEVAEDKQADLIIIASSGPGLQDYFLGSTAAKVVRHAQCSVLVMR